MTDNNPYTILATQSIHDRPQNGTPRPIIIKGQYMDFDWVLVALTFIIILVCIGLLAYSISNQPPQTPIASVIQKCQPGECATNIYNGVKTCPDSNTGIMTFDPTYQVCNSASVCTNSSTPYAVQNDGSVSLDGTCPIDTDCRCISRPQCGLYTLTAFQVINGNAYNTVKGQRMTLAQISSYNTGNSVSNVTPIQYDDVLSTFCAIPNSWVDRMGGVCERGELSYLAIDPSNFTLEQANNTPLSCMQGLVCSAPDQTQVWNSKVNQISCVNLCPSGQKPIWNDGSNQLECKDV